VSVVVLGGTKITEHTRISRVVLAKKGHPTGTATFTMTGHTVSVPLELSRTISDPGAGWRLTHPGQLL
jgi:serine-type D-Ala-D-Ala carboxypeptidase (penicillin-binding protein 5/6)